MSTEVKYINEKNIQSLLIPRIGKNVFMPLKERREAYQNRTVHPSVRPSVTNRARGSVIAHKLLKQI